MKKALVINDFTQMDNAHLRKAIDDLQREKYHSEERIRDLEAKLDELYLIRKSETAMQLEIKHLKDDNIRLLNMLKTTEEFKDFAYLAEDCGGGIRYVKSGSIYSDQGNQGKPSFGTAKCNCNKNALYLNDNSKLSSCKLCSCNESHNLSKKVPGSCKIKECVYRKMMDDTPFNDNNWVPLEAFENLRKFATKYRLNIDDSLAKELLYNLNLVWKDRELKQIQRIRNKYQTEILDLRRKLNNQDSMDQVLTKSENKKLKQDVKSARLDGNIIHNQKKNDGLDMVNSALKVASTFHKTKNALESEIMKLKKIIASKDDKNTQTQEIERLKFNEGALLISKHFF